jgi:hypothetical protein
MKILKKRYSCDLSAEGKSQLGRPWCRWKGNMKMDVRQTRFEVVAGFMWLQTLADGGLL